MERDWLAEQLEAGRSIESIAREVGKDPSTVAYWVNRHGLVSVHAARHAARGPLSRETLEALVEVGMTIRQMARELDRSASTVRHWLERYGLKTKAASRVRRDGSTAERVIRDCPTHGWTEFRRVGNQVQYRCAQCVIDAVAHRRAVIKEILLDEAGGRCTLCGYDRNPRALQFHHLDPTAKLFTLRNGNLRSLASMRAEAAKCVLLCANCHAEVESGSVQVPVPSAERTPSGVAQQDDPG
jgi:transposase-like protein/DNA-directed RNA polymerase subunit RPC12/RpoP